jgi:hypothetical protein
MKGDTPTPQESQQPNTKKKHPFYWIWLIVAIIGIGVVYLGLSDIYHRSLMSINPFTKTPWPFNQKA